MKQIWRKVVLDPEATLRQAIKVLADVGIRIVVVADTSDRLLGVLTDGDIRRALLRQVDMEAKISEVMNSRPQTAKVGESRESIRAKMEHHSLLQLPIVDHEGRIVGLEAYHQQTTTPVRDNWVFLMAGGLGTRLRPLTDNCPKPMLLVGGKPILERILEGLISAGFHRFYISIYYLPKMIKAHFGDGSRWGVTILYVEEHTPLGTGGALALLPEVGSEPILVMNGDVLTYLDFNALIDFHLTQQPALTICVREYEFQVPFGVVEGNGILVTKIVEKPIHRFFVNAGIYVLSSEVVCRNHQPRCISMPDLIEEMISRSDRVTMFPIHEYWLDVGRPDDYASVRDTGKAKGDN